MAPRRVTLVQYPGFSKRSTLSAPCAKVHMALAVKGVEYDVINVNSPMEAKRHNPRGRVPVLMLDDERIVDSTDILTALDRVYPEPPLVPADPGDAALVKIYEDWADEVLYFYGVYLRWVRDEAFARMKSEVMSKLPVPIRWLAPLIAKREIRRRAAGQGIGVKPAGVVAREFEECLDALVARLSGPFLVGGAITRADIAVVAMLDQLAVEILTPDTAAAIASRAPLCEYRDRVHEVAPDVARGDS